LLKELRKYDPVADGRGGPTWKPGGHFKEINGYKNGIKNDIKDYIEKCIKKPGGGPPAPPLPRWIDEAANRPVPLPVLPAGVLPLAQPQRLGPRPVPVPIPELPTFFTIPLILIDPCLVYPKLCFNGGT
jgi:hypothetical protein